MKPLIHRRVMYAGVALDLRERLDAGQEIVGDPPHPAKLVEVAVVVGREGAVGELAVLIGGAIGGGAGGELQAIKTLVDAERAAVSREQRVACETGLDVGAAGIV